MEVQVAAINILVHKHHLSTSYIGCKINLSSELQIQERNPGHYS